MPPQNEGQVALVAEASAIIDADRREVWRALVDPAAIKEYMFGTTVVSEWREGSAIVWQGEWEGRAYEDKGEIVRMEPGRILRYTHFSALSGQTDEPGSYHTVTIDLVPTGAATAVTLTQDNNPTPEAREHSARNWNAMLSALKEYVESRREAAA
jgi:uncharacterized protein YndB with AHSA1/START domain